MVIVSRGTDDFNHRDFNFQIILRAIEAI